MGFIAPLLPVLATVAGGFAASKMAGGGKAPSMPQPPALPSAPTPEDSAAKAKENARKRAMLSKTAPTVYTNPLGTQGQAEVARKTLLGQ